MINFSPAMFQGTATFYPAAMLAQLRDGPSFDVKGGPSQSLPCYHEAAAERPLRGEAASVPQSSKNHDFFTMTMPQATLDSLVVWRQRLFRVTALPSFSDGWNVYKTEAVEVV